MGRILLLYVLPILLPTLIYVGWLAASRRRLARTKAGEPARWQDAPWLWLAFGGVLLAALITLVTTLLERSGTEGRYVPPQMQDGRIIPGHVEPR